MKYLLLLLIFPSFYFSQNFSFIYETKYKLNSEKPEDLTTDYMILDIAENQSIFRESFDKKADSSKMINKKGMYKMGVENQFYVKKEVSQHKINKVISYLGNDYLLPIEEKLNWKIGSDYKVIDKFKTQKAELQYGGRNWTAWFSTELPFGDGPYVFCGLPGLILSIQDDQNEYVFNLIQVKKGGDVFDVRTKTIPIDWNKYDLLAKSYFNDPYDLNSKVGRKVTMTDANGNKMDLTDMKRDVQEEILKNNPIELNHKVNYK